MVFVWSSHLFGVQFKSIDTEGYFLNNIVLDDAFKEDTEIQCFD